MHKDVLTKSSDFFKACCDGHNWRESATKTIELLYDDADTISIYVQWLYTGELVVIETTIPADAHHRSKSEREEIFDRHFLPLYKLMIFGDKVGDSSLSNVIVDEILRITEVINLLPGPIKIRQIYPELPAESPIRKLLRHLYRTADIDYIDRQRHFLPADFVFDLMVELIRTRDQPRWRCPRFADRCKYHIHDDKIPKCT